MGVEAVGRAACLKPTLTGPDWTVYLLLLPLRVACSSKRAPVCMPPMPFTGSVYWHLRAHHVASAYSLYVYKEKDTGFLFCFVLFEAFLSASSSQHASARRDGAALDLNITSSGTEPMGVGGVLFQDS